jgi:hypothetical protein
LDWTIIWFLSTLLPERYMFMLTRYEVISLDLQVQPGSFEKWQAQVLPLK